jgi:predicted nucleotidyltransferase
MDIFEEDILEFFQLLNKHSVKFILVGGLAVNYHGFSRSTGDVDLWLDESSENRKKLVNALKEKKIEGCEAFLTYPLLAGFAEILLNNGVYIDLMSDLQFFKQNRFDECYQRADKFRLNDTIELAVLHINSLIEEKEKSSRPKDQEDASQLKKMHKK